MSSSADRFARTAQRVAAQQDARAARLAQQVRDFLQPHGHERALDVGTGAGALAFALAPLVREVVGLDPVPELLELARQRTQPNTEFVEGDGAALPFPGASFDLAGTHRTLHHVAEPERVVAELARVTRPGGHVLVVDQLAPDDVAAAATLHEFETVRDPSHMRLLANGCLCCAVRGDLVDTLADAYRKSKDGLVPSFDRVLIETTGLADPVPIIQTLVTDEQVAPSFYLDTVVALVDALHAGNQLDTQREAVKQVAVADLLLLSKTDLATPAQIEQVTSRLTQINRTVEIARVENGAIDPKSLFGRAALTPGAEARDVVRWLHPHATSDATACVRESHEDCEHDHARHDDRVQTFTLFHDAPASAQTLATWLTLLANFRGANLLRVKGLINVDGRPVIVQAVQTIIHEPVELDEWPGADRRSQVVFIVRDADRSQFERTLDALSVSGQQTSKRLLDPAAYAKFLEMAKTLT